MEIDHKMLSSDKLMGWLFNNQFTDLFVSNQPISLSTNPDLYYRLWIEAIHYYVRSVSIKEFFLCTYNLLLIKELKKANNDLIINYLLNILTIDITVEGILSAFQMLERRKVNKKELASFSKDYDCRCKVIKNTLIVRRFNTRMYLDLNIFSFESIKHYFESKKANPSLYYYCQWLEESTINHYFSSDIALNL